MSGFLYFVEGEPRNSVDIITEHSLGYALTSGCPLSPIALGATPSGKPGCLMAQETGSNGSFGYRPDTQNWQQYKSHWIGVSKA